MTMLPTLYKARGVPLKSPICAICVDRTRGTTQKVDLGYGVSVWLCEGHASTRFRTQRNGCDFVLTLERTWRAHECLTVVRHKALDALLRALKPTPRTARRPGSYAWPTLRQAAERAFAQGHGLHHVLRLISRTDLGHAR